MFLRENVARRASTWALVLCALSASTRASAEPNDAQFPRPEPATLHDAPVTSLEEARPPPLLSDAPVPPPPAGFDGKQALDKSDYDRKSERGYFTGLPLANYDSNFGLGLGVRAYYYYNGERSDPLFAYTPYFYRAFLQFFATTGGLQFHWLDIDMPTIADSPLRFRSQLIFQRNIEQHYFGLGDRAMRPLGFTGSPQTYRKFSDYEAALERVNEAGQAHTEYNNYRFTQPMLLLSLEDSILHGYVRPLFGLGFTYSRVSDYTGDAVDAVDANGHDTRATMAPTRLQEDCAARVIHGCSGGWNNFFRLGLSFDTRDYEPDPNRGVFVDAALDLGSHVLGSSYQWARAMIAPRVYFDPLKKWLDLVLAARGTFQVQSSTMPFFGMDYIPYTEDPRTGLGGLRTLRGFKQDRFVGPVMTVLNTEVRWTFAHFEAEGQRFALILVPDMDIGRTFDRMSEVSFRDWRRSQGGALRISWNLATILTTEYAFSDEDSAFYVNFNHMF